MGGAQLALPWVWRAENRWAAAVASLFIPGVGPVIVGGLLGAAILGTGGTMTGMAAAEALDEELASGLPHNDLFVYENALGKGRSVVVAMAEGSDVEPIRELLAKSGAEDSR